MMNTNTNTFANHQDIDLNLSSWSELLVSLNSPGFDANPLQEILQVYSSGAQLESSGPSNPPKNEDVIVIDQPDENTTNSNRSNRRNHRKNMEEVNRALKPKSAARSLPHASSEKKRRDKIREKLDILLSMTHARGKMDTTSKLENIIQHLRKLKHQTGQGYNHPTTIPMMQNLGMGMGMYPMVPPYWNMAQPYVPFIPPETMPFFPLYPGGPNGSI